MSKKIFLIVAVSVNQQINNFLYNNRTELYFECTVPTDVNGKIDFAKWEETASKIAPRASTSDPSAKLFKAVTYLVPAFRNPTGESLDQGMMVFSSSLCFGWKITSWFIFTF